MPKRRSRGNLNQASMSTEWALEVFDWFPTLPTDAVGSVKTIGAKAPAIPSFNLLAKATEAVSKAKNASSLAKPQSEGTHHNAYASVAVIKTWYGASEAKNKSQKKTTKNGVQLDSYAGLKSVSFSRSKGAPDGQCTAVIIGPLPPHTRPGNWVIVSSIEFVAFNAKGKSVKTVLPRFIGQIHTVDSNYTTQASGNIVAVHTLQIREWSSALTTIVRYDNRSVANLQQVSELSLVGATSAAEAIAGNLAKMGAKSESGRGFGELLKVAGQNNNAFEAAEAFLLMVGALNANTMNNKYAGLDAYKVGVTMPNIPRGLLDRLKMPATMKPQTAFAQGFAKMVLGHQQTPVHTDGTWNGVFGSIDKEYSERSKQLNAYRGQIDKQAIGVNTGILLQLGHGSAWSMIAGYCDPSMNEAFTDILYERVGSDIVARPAIFVRGKPYKTKAAEELADEKGYLPTGTDWKSMYDVWTYFEDLPRIRIPDVCILGMSLSNTSTTSPNYIWADFHGTDGIMQASAIQHWNSMNTVRLEPEMGRFGGQDWGVQSSFFYTGDEGTKWAQCRVALAIVWKTFNYRKASGTLTIKDTSIPLTLGFNIEFRFGDHILVAQIEAIQTQFHVNEAGVRETVTSIAFSNLMEVGLHGLEFLEPGAFGDMFGSQAKPTPVT